MIRPTWRVTFVLPLALVLCACGDAEVGAERSEGLRAGPGGPRMESRAEGASGWSQAPAPPLSGRVGSVMATIGDSIFIVGGWNFRCPPDADCRVQDTETYADGAAYDVKSKQWRAISAAPTGLRYASVAVLGEDVYALSPCDVGPSCAAGRALFRYRSTADAWDVLPSPDNSGGYQLVAVANGVVAYRSSDEDGSTPDYRFIAGDDQWAALPDDPLSPVYDRFVLEFEGRWLLFGSRAGQETKLAASYDPETGVWQELPASKTMGYQVWRAGSLLYLNPHFGKAGGGIFDPRARVWSALPEQPHYDLAGIIAQEHATYAYAAGWVLDTRTGRSLEIDSHPNEREVFDQVIAEAPALGLAVFGGQSWSTGQGELVNELWLWTPPAAD